MSKEIGVKGGRTTYITLELPLAAHDQYNAMSNDERDSEQRRDSKEIRERLDAGTLKVGDHIGIYVVRSF